MLKRFVRSYLPKAMQLALQKHRKARELARVRVEEEPDLKVVASLVQPGDTVVDAGANYGLYTRFLSDLVGTTGKVICFEPIPSTFTVLEHVVRKLRLTNVTAHACALSDRRSVVTMTIPDFDDGGENPYQAHVATSPQFEQSKVYRIQADTLDSTLADSGSVDFIKIDVEGHESACIRGGLNTLRRDRPALLIEVSSDLDNPSTPDHDTIGMLSGELNYSIHWFDGSHLRKRMTGDSSVNYFFLQDSHLERLAHLISP